MPKQFALTTSDNPNNPITHFDEWLEFDTKEKGYNTFQYLGRIAAVCDGLSEEDYNSTILDAMIDIIFNDEMRFKTLPEGIHYRIVFE